MPLQDKQTEKNKADHTLVFAAQHEGDFIFD
jgi:hypothetical protein